MNIHRYTFTTIWKISPRAAAEICKISEIQSRKNLAPPGRVLAFDSDHAAVRLYLKLRFLFVDLLPEP